MIHVLLAVHPSSRYPGKNARLAGYTVAWLAMEMLHMAEPVKVYTVGWRAELPPCLPATWQHFECDTGSHRGDLEHAERIINPQPGDVMVQAMLTQPLRRPGLLADLATLTRTHGSAVTACYARQDDWRTCTPQGTWNPAKGARCLLYDGALEAWQPGQVERIFTATAPHGVAVNYSGQPVDVDFPADEPGGLPAAWAALLLREYHCQP